MNVKKLNERLKNLIETQGDVLRSHHTLNGNPYTETDEGKFTFELLGVPIEYQLYKYTETDKETEEVVKERYEVQVTRAGEIEINQLAEKIKEEFKKQAKNMYGIDITSINGSNMIGIPNSATFRK